MTDILLRGALSALKTKIEALATSETATAEDLAMLGTALERIAGKTTAIEVEMLGEEQRAAVSVEVATSRDNALQAIADALAAADAAMANQQNLRISRHIGEILEVTCGDCLKQNTCRHGLLDVFDGRSRERFYKECFHEL